IDDYTVYLTPGQFRELADLLKRGEYVGVGARLAVVNGKLVVEETFPDSPAEDIDKDTMTRKLYTGDVVVSIDKKSTAGLSAEAAMRLLEGEAGTEVVLEVVRSDSMSPRPVRLTRRAFVISSV